MNIKRRNYWTTQWFVKLGYYCNSRFKGKYMNLKTTSVINEQWKYWRISLYLYIFLLSLALLHDAINAKLKPSRILACAISIACADSWATFTEKSIFSFAVAPTSRLHVGRIVFYLFLLSACLYGATSEITRRGKSRVQHYQGGGGRRKKRTWETVNGGKRMAMPIVW